MSNRSGIHGPASRRVAVAILAALIVGLSLAVSPAAAGSGGPTVWWGAKTGPIDIRAPKVSTVAALYLPAGRYLVMAKAVIVGAGGTPWLRPSAQCRLVLGSSVDSVDADPTFANGDGSRVPILLTVTGKLGSPGKAKLRCVGAANTGDARIRDIRITAIKAGLLTMRRTGFPTKTIGFGKPRIIFLSSPAPTSIVGDNAWHNAGTVALPAGRWWIIAKATTQNSSSWAVDRCAVYAGDDHDDLLFPIALNGEPGTEMPLALEVVHWFQSPGSATLWCLGPANFDVADVTITAIKAGRLSNIPLAAAVGWSSGKGNPRIISGWNDGPLSVPKGSTFKTIRKLDLPQGRWTVLAKLWFEGAAMPVTPVYDRTASCLLEFGADKDRAQVRYGNNISRFDPLVLSVAHTSHSDEPVKLKCRRTNVPGTGKVYFIKITALRAGPLTKRHL